ncbi:MAG: hypothetical protein P8R39_06480, partial [Alphaproteobacteria bacterium]|nr:hypothetical protein [Alphaproteobacteria bacterium]
VGDSNGSVIIQNFDPNSEDVMLFTFNRGGTATVNDLIVEQDTAITSDVIIRSPANAPNHKYVYLTVENASATDFNLSIDSNGDLLIN